MSQMEKEGNKRKRKSESEDMNETNWNVTIFRAKEIVSDTSEYVYLFFRSKATIVRKIKNEYFVLKHKETREERECVSKKGDKETQENEQLHLHNTKYYRRNKNIKKEKQIAFIVKKMRDVFF